VVVHVVHRTAPTSEDAVSVPLAGLPDMKNFLRDAETPPGPPSLAGRVRFGATRSLR
jgi:hypothetical protein